ncbi:MAG: YbdK family carboxylate-amine ligase [Actinomycetota bacterium]|nr:YbdK family carboxylate-amine ligase [Actinomycetota bacterium]
MIEAHFGESPPWSIGVEEELMILDAETLLLSPGVETLVRETEAVALPGRLKTELFASVVELNTATCGSVAEAAEALAALRGAADEAARRNALRLAGAGSHPISDPETQAIAPEPRYREFVDYAGVSARVQGVSGLHVHVGVPSADACFHALERVVPWLPVVLALSANSPYFAGRETGFASNRAPVLAQLPRSGAPPAFRSYAEWQAWVERLVRLGVTADYTRIWWDIRPHPRFGTLEVRMPDQPTSIEMTFAFVALIQALVVTALREPPPAHDASRRGDYAHNRWAAARFGVEAALIHPDGEREVAVRELVAELLARVEPAARELGGSDLLARLDGHSCEGDLQLVVGREHGLAAVCSDLVERTAGG